MQARLPRFFVPAVLALAIPAGVVLAQQAQDQRPQRRAGPSPETLARLQDGRIAMIKESLKLNDAQLKLWAPVEAQMRASFAARHKAREERRQARQQGTAPALPDRLDRASERMAERAQQMKAFSDALRPFYASLSDDQKAVAGVVLRQSLGGGRGFHGHGRRWAMHEAPAAEQK
jgi:hypothetical protein